MLKVEDKRACCGCSACAQRCPKHCITMQMDEEGFLYPFVDSSSCIECGLCEKVCPCINQGEKQSPLELVATYNPDIDVRQMSSSGGIMTMLADVVLKKDGVVFGARFNDLWEVEHGYTEKMEGISSFRGSKYVQSNIRNSYLEVEKFLKEGKNVLFSGTPCQVNGLNLFLLKDYSNLLTVAIACHSVPSPLVWKEYLKSLNLPSISGINFRDKRLGWENYGLSIEQTHGSNFFQEHSENPFMQLFLHNLITRESCFSCPAKNGRSSADIILGDCWGASQLLPNYTNDHKGISFVLSQSEKGVMAIKELGIESLPLQLDQVVLYNGGLTTKSNVPKEREKFWRSFHQSANKQKVIHKFAAPYIPGFVSKVKRFLKHHLSR